LLVHNKSVTNPNQVADLEKRVTRFPAATNTPANVVENQAFRDLFTKDEQRLIPSRKQLHSRIVPALAQEIQNDIKKKLQGREVSIMTDVWTNKGATVSLNGVVVSFVNDSWD
ncbi:hypothetical protein PENTCL1PPCAC_9609, partial [Pristionchus entomophagus]